MALARKFGVDEAKANAAALLHDIGVIIPECKREQFLKKFDVEVLPEESEFLLILHQKTSRVVAQRLFHISDLDILNAIECHTTLRPKASTLDMVLFLADKIQWDQGGVPPYYDDVIKNLNESLDKGSLSYIEYLLEHKSGLKVIHPWLLAAYKNLKSLCDSGHNTAIE